MERALFRIGWNEPCSGLFHWNEIRILDRRNEIALTSSSWNELERGLERGLGSGTRAGTRMGAWNEGLQVKPLSYMKHTQH